MNIVLNLDENSIQKLIKKLASHQVMTKNQYIRFFAKVSGVSVSVYSSGKVVFQGGAAEKIASDFGYQAQTISHHQENMIGTDEVGNGSYFGSLVVVASFVSADNVQALTKLGVADSKKLTDDKIRQIAPRLQELLPHVVLTVQPSKYNEVIEKGYNAVSIKVALHNQAIYLLEQKLDNNKIEQIVIDAFTTKPNYEKYVKKEKNQVSSAVTLIPKAEDQFIAVAASSVIARALFLDNLDVLSEQAGFHLPSGAGHASDQIAAKIIAQSGVGALNQFAKLHFANTQKAIKIADNRK
ncbi:MAG: ribonuclease HIII [Lactococcus sp.]